MNGLALRGPDWVAVRVHRGTLWTAAVLLVLSVALLVAVPLWAADLAEKYAGSSCPIRLSNGSCTDNTWFIASSDWAYRELMAKAGVALLLLPVAFALFVAGPLIARELESGTYRMSWTQSVSPARWLTTRTVLPALALGAGTAALIGMYRWARWAGPGVRGNWYADSTFPATGPVGVAYVLLAVALAALAALLVRRTLPAMGIAGAATSIVIWVMPHLRGHLWPTTYAAGNSPRSWPAGPNTWVQEQGLVDSSGKRLPYDLCLKGMTDENACWTKNHISGPYAVFHRASDYWPLQLVETGIVLALTALAAAAAFRLLRRTAA
ncbi:hypothetical protein [Streptomyces beijiangensis]|uniref:ABC transporter permease n=1 Tax=Streptomyces beijiangensis TaxID=163361 RepID=A0A939F666_9ACTN|nr:hypothetical protein [Streptomyces beijiangensis]MBO0512638.1 hypothetical protein [Streptomyces beijiangensis]